MNAYNAVSYGAHRNPFTLHQVMENGVLSKSGVIQAFRGYREGAVRPGEPPQHSEEEEEVLQHELKEAVESLHEDLAVEEYMDSLAIRVSTAYDQAALQVLQ